MSQEENSEAGIFTDILQKGLGLEIKFSAENVLSTMELFNSQILSLLEKDKNYSVALSVLSEMAAVIRYYKNTCTPEEFEDIYRKLTAEIRRVLVLFAPIIPLAVNQVIQKKIEGETGFDEFTSVYNKHGDKLNSAEEYVIRVWTYVGEPAAAEKIKKHAALLEKGVKNIEKYVGEGMVVKADGIFLVVGGDISMTKITKAAVKLKVGEYKKEPIELTTDGAESAYVFIKLEGKQKLNLQPKVLTAHIYEAITRKKVNEKMREIKIAARKFK